MISLSEVFSWLNHEDGSHLSNQSRFSIWQINDPKLPESQKDTVLEALVNSTRASQDDLEYAEVLVFAGKTLGEHHRLSEASYYLDKANNRYKLINQPYRAAVTQLMHAIVQLKIGANNRAYASFRSAREIFEQITRDKQLILQDVNHHLPAIEKDVVWYKGIIDQINEDWLAQPEEAYSWLNRFGESFLSEPAKRLRDGIIENINDRDYYRAYQQLIELQNLVRGSQEQGERGEVFAFSGLAYYQMGNGKDAEKFLRQAASLYLPERHHHTIVRWMHAMVIARDHGRTSEAIKICNDCVRCLEGLRLDSDHRNLKRECAWYEAQANNTRRAINKTAGLSWQKP